MPFIGTVHDTFEGETLIANNSDYFFRIQSDDVANMVLQKIAIHGRTSVADRGVRFILYAGGTSDTDPNGATLVEDVPAVIFATDNIAAFQEAIALGTEAIPQNQRLFLFMKFFGAVNISDVGGANVPWVRRDISSSSSGIIALIDDPAPAVVSGVTTNASTFDPSVYLEYSVASAAVADTLEFVSQPEAVIVGSPFPSFQVRAKELASGTTDTDYSTNVTVGDLGGNLGGTLSVAPVAGVATFNNVIPLRIETGLILTASSGSLTSDDSDPVNVLEPTPTGTIIAGGGMRALAVAVNETDVSIDVEAISLADGSPVTNLDHTTVGLAFTTRRGPTGEEVAVTLAPQTPTGAHADGGFCHRSNGKYRLDLPDNRVQSPRVKTIITEGSGVAGVRLICQPIDHTDSDAYAAPLTDVQMAAANRDDAIAFLRDGITLPATTGTGTVKNSAGDTVNVAVTTDPDAQRVVATATPV